VQSEIIENASLLKKEKDDAEELIKKSHNSMLNSFEVFKKIRTKKIIMIERREQGKQMLEK